MCVLALMPSAAITSDRETTVCWVKQVDERGGGSILDKMPVQPTHTSGKAVRPVMSLTS